MSLEFSDEQKSVIFSEGEGLAVLAGAGCGKTTTLVEKCCHLIQKKPEARIAAVSFTERSASDLREKLSLKLPHIHHHWVKTIHGLCRSIVKDHPHGLELDGEERVQSELESDQIWRRALFELWKDQLPFHISESMDFLLERESHHSLLNLLNRVRQITPFGVLDQFEKTSSKGSVAWELCQVARYVLKRYAEEKNRLGVLDFNDLEIFASQVLDDPQVRRRYHHRFDLILVDEFQDTNLIQAKIVWNLARPDQSNLCVVGDPKQSIYRFRDADLSVFEEYCSKLPKKKILSFNFRSRPEIIQFTNHVCDPLFTASQLPYDELRSTRKSQNEEVIVLDLKSHQDLASFVKKKCESGEWKLGETVLLMRQIRGNEKWIQAMQAAGIPISIGSGGLFWEDPRVRELMAFLKWWENPGNQLSGAVFLRAPWVGVEDQLLDQWIESGNLRKSFFESNHRLALLLKVKVDNGLRPGEILLELLKDRETERQVGVQLLGLWHRAEELSYQGFHRSEVIQGLSHALQENRREREVPPARDQGVLRVLTLHGSKGLEFPHVILVDFRTKKRRASDAPIVYWDRKKGVYLAKRLPDGRRDRKDEAEQDWRAFEIKKDIDESKRLFYVGLTRAQENLILGFLDEENSQKEQDPSVLEQDHWRAWVEYSSPHHRRVKEFIQTNSSSLPSSPSFYALRRNFKPIPQSRLRHSVTELSVLSSCPKRYEWQWIRVKDKENQEIDGRFSSAPGARDLGTEVHSCLETRDWEGLKKLEETFGKTRFLADPLIQWAQRSPLFEAHGKVFREFAFEVPLAGGEVIVGAMDQVNVLDGKVQIIDYKISKRRKSILDLKSLYQKQLEIYAWALRQLEKKEVETFLVAVSPEEIQEVKVEISEDCLKKDALDPLILQANAIISGQQVEAKKGNWCQYCDFTSECPTYQGSFIQGNLFQEVNL